MKIIINATKSNNKVYLEILKINNNYKYIKLNKFNFLI